MRIIAGEFRGRRLLPPTGDNTRPITDRAKQSLFDILAPLIPNSVVYDCFAGTGSMGLECLSRGAKLTTFFEADRSAVKLLMKNIKDLQIVNRAIVMPTDLFAWFRSHLKPSQRPVDLIFLDPPYRFLRERADDLRELAHALVSHLAPDGVVVFRHDAGDSLALPPFTLQDRREYGGMAIDFLRYNRASEMIGGTEQ
jgi:16S rRNA (guanine(966)-N(2))-methyltransferase RsmD